MVRAKREEEEEEKVHLMSLFEMVRAKQVVEEEHLVTYLIFVNVRDGKSEASGGEDGGGRL